MTADSPALSDASVRAWRQGAIAAALAVMAAATVARVAFDASATDWPALGGYLVFAGLAIAGQVARIRILFATALALAVALFATSGEPLPVLLRGLETAAFLASFLLLLGMLREAAVTSPAVRDCGAFMTGQPPGRRYLAIHVGSHFLAALLNFGVLSLLGPMIQRGVAALEDGGDRGLAAVRERRQLSALLRGFSWIIAWSPTTITQALLVTLLPGVEPLRLMALGAGLALVMLPLGWAEDRFRWRALARARRRSGPPPSPVPAPRRALLRLAAVCGLLAATILAARTLLGIATVPALMLSVPCFALAWILVQPTGGRPAPGAFAHRLREISGRGFAAAAPEVLTLSIAGLIGVLAAALVPAELLGPAVRWAAREPLLLLAGIMLLVMLAAQVALSPMTFVVFLGSALAKVPLPDVDWTLVALALGAGWALTLTGSPFTASVLILSRVTGVEGTRISWYWNGTYSLLGLAASVAAFWIILRWPG